MIYFAPVRSITLTAIRRYGRFLLALPFCVVLISCDNASSNTDQGMINEVIPIDSSASADLANSLSDNSDGSQGSDSDRDSEQDNAEGQSLITSAQPSNESNAYQTQTDSKSHSSALQATLMGDYGGMVPCASCDNIDVTLNLFADGSVLKTSIYNNPKTPRAPLLESGIYRQDNNKITIVYQQKQIETYSIQDNHLVLMDENESPNNDYTLSRK
ncbi:copper resistance protein NlpE N-terminal domain-containing protein [Psychrobacter sp. NZS113]|uniref:copper resistance protein NlpE N-terminal domain-containing protein n=1 Tax=Psychrobacter sp. NZS113 TaxID=2792045 RepID=UPI0018CD2324|nr:copper resistance protein NlpE N-terminal domain-containing protein [Psychrobacter sp. NZS113]MBH0094887.1 copper resistance protein NlpE N-terminal domain-containing protein [Psychrobacter sp. NZS113]